MLLIVKKKWQNHSPQMLTSLIKLILDKEGGNPWPQLIQAEQLFMIGQKWMKTCQKNKAPNKRGKKCTRWKDPSPGKPRIFQSWPTTRGTGTKRRANYWLPLWRILVRCGLPYDVFLGLVFNEMLRKSLKNMDSWQRENTTHDGMEQKNMSGHVLWRHGSNISAMNKKRLNLKMTCMIIVK
jgi:hypothetical protein